MKNKTSLNVMITALVSMLLATSVTFAQMSKSQLITEMIKRGDNRYAGHEVLKSVQSEHQLITQLKQQKEFHHTLQNKLQAIIEPHVRMYALEYEMRKLLSKGHSQQKIHKALKTPLKLMKTMTSGSISGTVTMGDDVPGWGAVMFYDEFGYLVTSVQFDENTGTYQVDGLAAGIYYVRYSGDGVDEFYDSIYTDATLENWRQVVDGNHFVEVLEGQNTAGIDFTIEEGSYIEGMVYDTDGTTPVSLTAQDWPYPEFTFYRADTETQVWSSGEYHTSNGEYGLTIEYAGDGILSCSIADRATQYYNQKTEMADADLISLTYADTAKGIDFIMQPGEPEDRPGWIFADFAHIEGKVSVAGGLPPFFAIIALFNADDTTLSNWTTTSVLELGEYNFGWIQPGNYLLYADDMMGNTFPEVSNYIGEYYQDAYLPQNATVVTVAKDDTARNIDFTLEAGGSISGNVKNTSGNPVDSTLIVALESSVFHMMIELPFGPLIFNNIKNADFAVGRTDSDGNYLLNGLPEGNYKVRTLSFFTPMDRQHVDEYYPDIKNILHYDQAADVSVGPMAKTNAEGIDFVLDPAGTITGMVYDEDGVTPVENVLVFAAVDSNGLPAVTPPDTTGEDGKYILPGLAEDKWKVMAVPLESDVHVPEWYESVRGIDDATALDVKSGETTEDIDFTLNVGGFIQGIVNLDENYRAGNDTLWNFPIIVYESETGVFAGLEPVTQMGGYRIGQLKPGNYKVCAMPAIDGYGVSYHGGGITFDDVKSVDVVVEKADSVRADIDMVQASGIISGTVYGVDCQTPLASIMLATDQTGHAISFSLSGVDRSTGEQLETRGDYVLYGIHDGEWHVRTNAMMGIVDFLFDMNGARIAKSMNCDGPHYSDEYANNQQVNPDDDHNCYSCKYTRNMASSRTTDYETSMKSSSKLLSSLTKINKDLYRWNSNVIVGASRYPVMMSKSMAKSSQAAVTDVDFCLSEYNETDVENPEYRTPGSFALYQNYPNPFNPETNIQYHLPQNAEVTLAIYNTAGQRIITLVSQNQSAGIHNVIWNGLDATYNQVPSGLYVYKLTAGDFKDSKKLLLVR